MPYGETYTRATPNYRKIIGFAVAAVLSIILLITVGCNTVQPDNGFEAVLVKKPLFFGHGGIDPTPVKTGLTFVAPTTTAIFVNTQPIQAEVKADDLMTNDGVPLSFDAIIRVQVTDSVQLIQNFGGGWYENNLQKEFQNLIRQAVRKHGLNETAINPTAISDIDHEVKTGLETYITNAKLPVRIVAVTVGRAIPPDSIKNQRIETAAQQQRIITEGQVKLAEDARKAAETSRAAADNAYRNEMQLSPDQFLKLEAIKAMHDVCKSGAKCTFFQGAAGGTPIVDGR